MKNIVHNLATEKIQQFSGYASILLKFVKLVSLLMRQAVSTIFVQCKLMKISMLWLSVFRLRSRSNKQSSLERAVLVLIKFRQNRRRGRGWFKSQDRHQNENMKIFLQQLPLSRCLAKTLRVNKIVMKSLPIICRSESTLNYKEFKSHCLLENIKWRLIANRECIELLNFAIEEFRQRCKKESLVQ